MIYHDATNPLNSRSASKTTCLTPVDRTGRADDRGPNDVTVPEHFVDTSLARQDRAVQLDGVESAASKVVDILFAGEGLAFGYEADNNFYEFQDSDGSSAVGRVGKDVRLVHTQDGTSTPSDTSRTPCTSTATRPTAWSSGTPPTATRWSRCSSTSTAAPHYTGAVDLDAPLAEGNWFGVSSWSSRRVVPATGSGPGWITVPCRLQPWRSA